MLIDWFTVVAQALNFLVLVWLLHRFLYRPILAAIDERQRRVQSRLDEARAARDEAQGREATLRKSQSQLEQDRAALLQDARALAEEERRRLVEKAREDCAEMRAGQRASLAKEQGRLHDELIRRIRCEVMAVCRRALSDLADHSLEDAMVRAFVRRWRATSEGEGPGWGKSLVPSKMGPSPEAVVESALPLSVASREAVTRVAGDLISPAPAIRFVTEPDLIAGMRLRWNGWQVAWTVDDYLSRLEKSWASMVEEEEAAAASENNPVHENAT